MIKTTIKENLFWAGYTIKILPNGEGVTATKGDQSRTACSALALRKKIFEY